MKKMIVMTLGLLIMTSCRPSSLWFISPEGPPEFQLGWEDGCDTGLSAQDKDAFYSLIYGYKKRPEMLDNDWYTKGWSEGFQYCRYNYANHQ